MKCSSRMSWSRVKMQIFRRARQELARRVMHPVRERKALFADTVEDALNLQGSRCFLKAHFCRPSAYVKVSCFISRSHTKEYFLLQDDGMVVRQLSG